MALTDGFTRTRIATVRAFGFGFYRSISGAIDAGEFANRPRTMQISPLAMREAPHVDAVLDASEEILDQFQFPGRSLQIDRTPLIETDSRLFEPFVRSGLRAEHRCRSR